MSIVETALKMTDPSLARNHLEVNGFDPGDIEAIMADWPAKEDVSVSKPETVTTRSFKSTLTHDDDD